MRACAHPGVAGAAWLLLHHIHTMKTGLHFLIAARECEIAELEQLALASELVGVISRLVHALQRERGLSNVFLGSQGRRFADQRLAQLSDSDALAARVLSRFSGLDTAAGGMRNGARLFSRIALVLYEFDGLHGLRERVQQREPSPEEATAAYTRLIAGLLAVVFEAADSATDPEISRALVAMFNFMQGKEFTGQERALGGAVFACGQVDPARQQQWQHLIESQERCFQVATDFAGPQVREAWQGAQHDSPLATLERLRRIGCGQPAGGRLDPELSQTWYAHCTERIDRMKDVEERLGLHLHTLCAQRIALAQAELRDQQAIQRSLVPPGGPLDTPPAAGYGPGLERAILSMVQDQSRRLQDMTNELETVRASLNERKVIERAKGLLMAARKLSEAEAHKMLRDTAMNQNRKLLDVAQSVLSLSDYL